MMQLSYYLPRLLQTQENVDIAKENVRLAQEKVEFIDYTLD